jgi:hypothetical protein
MRVLLVEDDPTTSKSIELMLTHANINVKAYPFDYGITKCCGFRPLGCGTICGFAPFQAAPADPAGGFFDH